MYAETVQAAGTLITIAGLVVVAPVAAGRVLPELWQWNRQQMRRVRGWVARFLPFLRRHGTIHTVSGSAVGTSGTTGWAAGRAPLSDQGTTEQQLAAIRRAVEAIYSELSGLRAEQSALRAELLERLEQLRQDHTQLQHLVHKQRDEQNLINARGFPLAAAGALLAGTPSTWLVKANASAQGFTTSAPTLLWWLLVVVGAVALVVAVRWVWQLRQELGTGWREGFPPRAPSPKG